MAFHVPDSEWVIGSAHAATTSRRRPFGLGRLADERLAQLVAAGRERAFAVLYERYHQPLYRYCRSMLRNDQDAQDALQSTFAAALAALQESKRNAPFRPWLFRIAHNEAITVIRRRRDAGQEISDSMLGSARSASDEADDRARVAVLMGDLAQLPERQRAALLMRELNGLSHAEISVALATTDTAAKQAIFDARNALTEFAEGRALACEEVRRKISERDGRVLRSRRVRSHLRDCSGCAAFAAAISERRSDLRALVPLLPAATSAAPARAPRGRIGAGVRRCRWRRGGREAGYDGACFQGRGGRLRRCHRRRRARRASAPLPLEHVEGSRDTWSRSRVAGARRCRRSSGHGRRPGRGVTADRKTARGRRPTDATTSRPRTGESHRHHQSGRRRGSTSSRTVPARRFAGARSARQECATARQERAVARQEQRGARPQQGRGSGIHRCGIRRHRHDQAQARPAR